MKRRAPRIGPIAVGFVAALGVLALRPADDDLHRRLQEARLTAELSCGRSTILASEPTDPTTLARFDWPEWLELAAHGEPHERWRAIELLGEFGGPQAVPALLRALADPQGTVRPCLAAQSLGRIGDERAIQALIEAAGQRGNEDLRLCATKSLGLLRSERAVPVLIDSIERGDMAVAAAYALARIGSEAGAQAVARATREPSLAPWLVGPLGEFGLPAAVEPDLRRLADSPSANESTRLAAREGLWKLEVLRSDDDDPAASLATALQDALREESSPARRAWAAWRLGDGGFGQATEALADALADPSERVALAAAAALLRFGIASEPALLARLDRPGAAGRLAIAAVGLVGTERSGVALRDLDDPLAARSLAWLRARPRDRS
jgi:hypothetical protein